MNDKERREHLIKAWQDEAKRNPLEAMQITLDNANERIEELERRVDVLFEMMGENISFAKNMAELLKEMRAKIVGDES